MRNFENHLYVQQAMDSDTLGSSTYGAGTLGFKDKGGTGRSGISPSDITNSGTAGASGSGYRGASGSDTHGILVGTSTAAFSFEGFELTAQVAEGTCTGEMSHVAMADYTAANVVYNSCTLKWTTTYERFFNNNSGGSITVEEVGLVADEEGLSGTHMMARDVLGCSALAIADAGQLKVTYTIVSPAIS